MVLLAGAEAETRFRKSVAKQRWQVSIRTGSNHDAYLAHDLASYFTSSYEETDAYLRWLKVRTSNLIETHWDSIRGLASQLLERRTMSAAEVREALVNTSNDPTEPPGPR